MAVAFAAEGTRLAQTGTSWNVAYPSGISAGDVLVIHMVTNGGAVNTQPAGFTAILNETTLTNPRGGVWYKVATGSESGTVNIGTQSSVAGGAQMFRYTGVDTSNPIDGTPTTVRNSTATTTSVMASITISSVGAMLIYCNAGNSSSTLCSSTTGTERVDHVGDGAGARTGALYDEVRASAGATGTRTITMDGSRTNWGAMFALRAAATSSNFSGSLTLTRDATLTVSGSPKPTGTLSRTATRTLTTKTAIATLKDDFSVDRRAQIWPAYYNTVAIEDGVAKVTATGASSYSGLKTYNGQYSLVGSYLKVQVTPATDPFAVVTLVSPTAGTDISALFNDGRLYIGTRTGYGFNTLAADVAAPAGTPIWYGVGEGVAGAAHFGATGTNGNLYFFTSDDGLTWTQVRTEANPSYVDTLTVFLEAGEGVGTVIFDNVNTDPPPRPAIETLQDDFTTDDLATKWPGSSGTYWLTNGTLGVVADDMSNTTIVGGSATSRYSLTNSYAFVKFTPPTVPDDPVIFGGLLMVGAVGSEELAFRWNQGTVQMGVRLSDAWQGTTATVTHGTSALYYGIAEGAGAAEFGGTGSAGTVYFYTSTDGVSWTQRLTVATPSYASAIIPRMFLAREGFSFDGFSAYFDNFNVTPENYTGSLTLTSTRSLTVSGTPSHTGSLTRTVTGTTTVGGVPSHSGTLTTSVTTSVTASGTPLYTGSLTMNVTAATSVGGTPSVSAPLNLTATRTLDVNGSPSIAVSLNRSVARTLTVDGTATLSGTLNRTATTSLIINGSPATSSTLNLTTTASSGTVGIPTLADALALTRTRALTLTSAFSIEGTLARSLAGALTLDGAPAISADLTLSRTRTLTFGATITQSGDVLMSRTIALTLFGEGVQSGGGSLYLAVTPASTVSGSAAITGTLNRTATPSLTLSGVPSLSGNLNLSASRSLSGDTTPNAIFDLVLTAATSLVGTTSPAITSTLNLERDTTVLLYPAPGFTDVMALTRTLSLGLVGAIEGAGGLAMTRAISLSLTGSASLVENLLLLAQTTATVTGSPAFSGDVDLLVDPSLDVDGSPSMGGALDLSATGTVSGGGTPAPAGNLPLSRTIMMTVVAEAMAVAETLNLTGTRSLVLEGVAFADGQGSLNLSAGTALELSGWPIINSAISLPRTGTLTVDGTPETGGSLSLSRGTSLGLDGSPSSAGTLTLERQRTLTVAGAPAFAGTLDLTASGQWTLDGVPVVSGSLIIVAEGVLTLLGEGVAAGGVQMLLKDGTRLHAFILVGGILVPVTPTFTEN